MRNEVVAIDMWSNRQVVWRALLFGLLLVSWTAVNSALTFSGWYSMREDIRTNATWINKHEAQIRAINQVNQLTEELAEQNALLKELLEELRKEN